MTRLANNKQRTLIVGRTGSGKTQGAVWHLSKKDLNSKPWVVINHKGDDLIDSIDGAQHVGLDIDIKKPGLYIVHPIPEVDDADVTKLMWRIHARGGVGVYIDEGYMIDAHDPALLALLTQGRSKQIPMIILTQRPVWLTRFAISESDFYQLYHIQDVEDRKRIKGFMPLDLEKLMRSPANTKPQLPEFHSVYHDVGRNETVIMSPVPSADKILSSFNLNTRRRTVYI